MNSCPNCNLTFPSKIIIEGKMRILSNRKYCLVCSPFGSRNTFKLETLVPGKRYCSRCNNQLSVDNFYSKRGKPNSSAYCKQCTIDQVNERSRFLKLKAVEYKGNKCYICGYSKCLAALDFHHRDPTKKDFAIAAKMTSFEQVRAELDKCDLLCANCHRELHSTFH